MKGVSGGEGKKEFGKTVRAALDNDGVAGEEGRKNTGDGKTYERAERWKLRLRVKGVGGGVRKKGSGKHMR